MAALMTVWGLVSPLYVLSNVFSQSFTVSQILDGGVSLREEGSIRIIHALRRRHCQSLVISRGSVGLEE